MKSRSALWALLAAALTGSLVWGQTPSPKPPEPSPSPSPSADKATDTIKSILEQELAPQPGQYTYNAQGRRDPFVSLIRPVGPDQGPRSRKPGMEGFLIQEVALKGIVKQSGGGLGAALSPGYIALLLGTDGKTYFCTLNQRLFDGQITAMDATTVTFRQDVTDPLSPVRTREVRKTLYPSEEARQ